MVKISVSFETGSYNVIKNTFFLFKVRDRVAFQDD